MSPYYCWCSPWRSWRGHLKVSWGSCSRCKLSLWWFPNTSWSSPFQHWSSYIQRLSVNYYCLYQSASFSFSQSMASRWPEHPETARVFNSGYPFSRKRPYKAVSVGKRSLVPWNSSLLGWIYLWEPMGSRLSLRTQRVLGLVWFERASSSQLSLALHSTHARHFMMRPHSARLDATLL